MMRKTTQLLTVLALFVLFASTASALEATIQPSDPDDITLDSDNNYEVSKQFDGTASTGSISTYTWDLVGSSQSDTGPQATFTFTRDDSSSNTVRLTVANETDSDVAEVTQVLHDVPNISISPNSQQDIETGDSVDFTSSVTNSFDGPVSYSWKVGGSEKGTQASFSHTFDNAGDHTVNLTVEDNAGNKDWKTVTVSVSSPDGGDDDGGSGGGSAIGGGGLGAGTPKRSKIFNQLTPGANVSMSIDKSEQYGVSSVRLSVSTPAQDVKISVEKQEGKPADVSVNVSGKTYRYLNINAENLDETQTEQARIRFRVNKSWMEDNDINRSTIRLERYSNDRWQQLSTKRVAETDARITYEATTPGFSYFAIAADENQEQEQQQDNGTDGMEEELAVCGDDVCQSDETWETCSQDCAKPQQVVDAEQAIDQAEQTISQDDPGYDKLQQAQQAYDAGDYQQAVSLADEAVTAYQQAQEQPQEQPSPAIVPILVLSLVFLLIPLLLVWKWDWLMDRVRGDPGNYERRFEEATTELKQLIEADELSDEEEEEVLEKIDSIEAYLDKDKRSLAQVLIRELEGIVRKHRQE